MELIETHKLTTLKEATLCLSIALPVGSKILGVKQQNDLILLKICKTNSKSVEVRHLHIVFEGLPFVCDPYSIIGSFTAPIKETSIDGFIIEIHPGGDWGILSKAFLEEFGGDETKYQQAYYDMLSNTMLVSLIEKMMHIAADKEEPAPDKPMDYTISPEEITKLFKPDNEKG